jgi:hypothetical protein
MATWQGQEATWEFSNAECYHDSHHVVFACAQVFLVHKRFDISRRKLCLSVHRCGETPGAYRYSLELQRNGGRQTAQLSDLAHGETESVEHVFLSGDCVMVDFDMIMAFVKGTRLLRIVRTGD